MSGPNGNAENPCKWCGHAERLDGNEYCSPDCYYNAHDSHQLHTFYSNDRRVLERTLANLNASLSELERSLNEDGLLGEDAHAALRETAESMRRDANGIKERIQRLSENIADIERRF
jgi:hypothetical protein